MFGSGKSTRLIRTSTTLTPNGSASWFTWLAMVRISASRLSRTTETKLAPPITRRRDASITAPSREFAVCSSRTAWILELCLPSLIGHAVDDLSRLFFGEHYSLGGGSLLI